MKKGKITKTGYKSNSPDRYNDFNIIPSNRITMKNVNFPILGISNLGDTKMMYPNQEYNFNGNTVTEFPMAKSGIHIDPKNKGKFNALKKKTGKSTEELTHSKNPLTRKRAIFAQNAAKWNKGQYGAVLSSNNSLKLLKPFAQDDLEDLQLKNALIRERKEKRDSVRFNLNRQFPNKYSQVTKGMLEYYKTEPPEYLQLDINLLDQVRREKLLQKYGKKNFKKGGKIEKGQDGLSINPNNYIASSNPNSMYETIPTFNNQKEHDAYYRQQVLDRNKGTDIYNEYMSYGVNEPWVNDKADALLMAMGGIPRYVAPKAINPGAGKPSRILDIDFKTKKTEGYRYDKGLPDIESINSYKYGGPIKKAQQGFSMTDIPQYGATQIDLPDYQPQGPYDMFSSQQYQNTSSPQGGQNGFTNFYNRIGGMNGVAQGAMSVGQVLQRGTYEGGPSGAQQMVGQFGPWGQAISQVSQIGTNITDKSNNVGVYTAGKVIFDPAAAWTNKDLSTEDRIMGGLNPIYGGIQAFKAKKNKEKKERMLNDLIKRAGESEDVNINNRRYVRPEDQVVDPNELYSSYGTGTSYLKHGGNVPYMEKGGELETYWGGEAQSLSENPYLPGDGETIMFKGNSHKEGGIGVKFGNSPVEVEGGEPAIKVKDGRKESLVVFGDMKIPSYGVSELNDPKAKGKKFKNYVNELSKIENKQNETVEKGVQLVNDTPITDSFDKLKVSSGKAMIEGGNMKLKEIAAKKQIAANVQNAILETADELGLKSDELAKGKFKKAKMGKKIPGYQDGGQVTIPRYKMDEYIKYGYTPDPNDPNRLYRDLTSSGTSVQIPVPPPGKGSEEFNRAFAQARKQNLAEFTWKGKNYTTDLFQGRTKTITNPGTTNRDYIYLQDDVAPAEIPMTFPYNEPVAQSTSTETPSFGRTPVDWMGLASSILPMFRPTNQRPLDPNQLMGEKYALATNQLEPVQAQLYRPLLENVSDISLQDQLNANQADFNAIQRYTAQNPAAQATLAAQKYQANSSVLGEQFRQNQNQRMGVYNRNRGVLNDATLKNLGILDQQYVRQSQAKSNTKAVAQAAINSISDKIARNKLENRTLGVYENLYNYRFDNSGRAWNWNGFAQFNVDSGIIKVDKDGKTVVDETKVKRDRNGNIINSTETQRVTSDNKKKNGGVVKAIKNL